LVDQDILFKKNICKSQQTIFVLGARD